ncbi:hypothetical protein NHQ30_009739 [Ciborinia camelliae]|nr:hypothetical protein NHQ30_009739 [Ciborinia camelliae]
MFITSILYSLLVGSTIVGAAAIKPRVLDHTHLILTGDNGRTEVVDKAEFFAKHFATYGEAPGPIPAYNETLDQELTASINATLSKRGQCHYSVVLTAYPDNRFLGWDVPMSKVVVTKEAQALIAATSGKTIANALGVDAGTSFTLIANWLTASFGINYTKTWTSAYQVGYTFTLLAHSVGAVVSNPWTLRKSGHVDYGCVGHWGTRVHYSGDSFTDNKYDDLNWVSGTVSLCSSSQYPLKRCLGAGYMN